MASKKQRVSRWQLQDLFVYFDANGSNKEEIDQLQGRNDLPLYSFSFLKLDEHVFANFEQILLLTHHWPSGLNGQVCKVKAPKDADRFDVQLVDGSIKAVKTDNLRAVAEPGSLVKPFNVEQARCDQMLGKGSWTIILVMIGFL